MPQQAVPPYARPWRCHFVCRRVALSTQPLKLKNKNKNNLNKKKAEKNYRNKKIQKKNN